MKKEAKDERASQDSDNFLVNADALQKQKTMLRTMSTQGLFAKWGYLKNCDPVKTKARSGVALW